MVGEEKREGGDEEICAFVVEEAGDYDYGYGVVGEDGEVGVWGWGEGVGVAERFWG